MTAQEKIDKILRLKKIDFNDFAMGCKIIPNSLKAAIKRNALTSDIITKIHDKYDVRKEFLSTGEEPVFIAASAENHAQVRNGVDKKEKPLGDDPAVLMKALFELEKIGEYRFVPKTVLEGEYRLELVSEIEERRKERDRTVEALNRYIANLERTAENKEKEIEELKSRIASLTIPQKQK